MGSVPRRRSRYSPRRVEEPSNFSLLRIECRDFKTTSQLSSLIGFPRAQLRDVKKQSWQPGRCTNQYCCEDKGYEDLGDYSR